MRHGLSLEDLKRAMRQCAQYMQDNPHLFPLPSPPKRKPPPDTSIQFRYIGKPQNIMPRSLLLDTRLTPLERNAWQALHFMIVERGLKYPRYEDLQPYLSAVPCGEKASRETVARVLQNLRLTRWLSLVTHLRDDQGRLRAPIYVLHDEPLTPAEALQLDEGYGGLIKRSLKHAAKGVRITAGHVLGELRRDQTVPAAYVPKVLALVPLAPEQHSLELQAPSPAHESEQPSLDVAPPPDQPQRQSELPAKAPDLAVVRIPNRPSTVQERIEQKSTVLRENEKSELAWPANLPISASDRQIALQAMTPLPNEARVAVLQEAVARCTTGAVRRPAAYLMGLIRKAIEGDFRLWAARDIATKVPPPKAVRVHQAVPEPKSAERSGAPRSASPMARACLDQLRRQCGLMSSA